MLAFFPGEFERREIDVAFCGDDSTHRGSTGGATALWATCEAGPIGQDGPDVDQDRRRRTLYIRWKRAHQIRAFHQLTCPMARYGALSCITDAPMPSGSVRYAAVPQGAIQYYPDGALPTRCIWTTVLPIRPQRCWFRMNGAFAPRLIALAVIASESMFVPGRIRAFVTMEHSSCLL